MKKIIVIIAVFSITFTGFSQTALFSSDFEDQNIEAEIGEERFEVGTSGGYQVVDNPYSDSYNSSNYVLKVFTNPGTGGRAEYQVTRHETLDKSYIYTWKRYHPIGMWTDISLWQCLQNQWKTWPCYDTLCQGGDGIFNDFSIFEDMTGDYRSRGYPNCKYDFMTSPQGYWHKFTLEVNWTLSENGYYSIWRNDTLVGYSDNIKTLPNTFTETECDIYWTTGLYSGWSKNGGETQDSLISYLDDVAVYDIDSGFTITDICPNCEAVPSIPTDKNVYKLNLNVNRGADYDYNNYIISYKGDTSKINLSNTFAQNKGIDIYLWSGFSTTSNTRSSDECFPSEVINSAIFWSDTISHKIILKDLDTTKLYMFKILSSSSSGSNMGAQIWTNKENQTWTTNKNCDTIVASGNSCNIAELVNLFSDPNGDLTIYIKAIGGRAYLNAIEIVEYDDPCYGTNINISSSITQDVLSKGVGAIDITVTGNGAAPYEYSWSNSEISQDISGLLADQYSVTVIDNHGCTNSAEFTIIDLCDTTNLIIKGSIQNESDGLGDGQIELSISGGKAPYTFLWNNKEITKDLTGLVEGTYEIVVKDNNGCSDSAEFRVKNVSTIIYIEKTMSSGLNIHPIPVSEILVIEGESVLSSVTIYNFDGRKKIYKEKNLETINVSDLPEGIYIISIKTKDTTIQRKFIKN